MGEVMYYEAQVVSQTDYYPGGMQIQERTWSASSYRFGFNGKENDDEIKGSGNSVAFEARIYDSRLMRFLSVDPLYMEYSWQSTYVFAHNSPIALIDYLGMGDPPEEGSSSNDEVGENESVSDVLFDPLDELLNPASRPGMMGDRGSSESSTGVIKPGAIRLSSDNYREQAYSLLAAIAHDHPYYKNAMLSEFVDTRNYQQHFKIGNNWGKGAYESKSNKPKIIIRTQSDGDLSLDDIEFGKQPKWLIVESVKCDGTPSFKFSIDYSKMSKSEKDRYVNGNGTPFYIKIMGARSRNHHSEPVITFAFRLDQLNLFEDVVNNYINSLEGW